MSLQALAEALVMEASYRALRFASRGGDFYQRDNFDTLAGFGFARQISHNEIPNLERITWWAIVTGRSRIPESFWKPPRTRAHIFDSFEPIDLDGRFVDQSNRIGLADPYGDRPAYDQSRVVKRGAPREFVEKCHTPRWFCTRCGVFGFQGSFSPLGRMLNRPTACQRCDPKYFSGDLLDEEWPPEPKEEDWIADYDVAVLLDAILEATGSVVPRHVTPEYFERKQRERRGDPEPEPIGQHANVPRGERDE